MEATKSLTSLVLRDWFRLFSNSSMSFPENTSFLFISCKTFRTVLKPAPTFKSWRMICFMKNKSVVVRDFEDSSSIYRNCIFWASLPLTCLILRSLSMNSWKLSSSFKMFCCP